VPRRTLVDADRKLAALRGQHAAHPDPDAVRDGAFRSGNPFFDPRDLVQVRYEMLRRVRDEGQSVTETASAFGVSRQGFYASASAFAQEGLPGLVPERPGPRRAHKLSDLVVDGACARDRPASLASPRRTSLGSRGSSSGSASTGAVSSGRWHAEKGGSARRVESRRLGRDARSDI
jgi:hypothetical protein